jgi:hypothetical protein
MYVVASRLAARPVFVQELIENGPDRLAKRHFAALQGDKGSRLSEKPLRLPKKSSIHLAAYTVAFIDGRTTAVESRPLPSQHASSEARGASIFAKEQRQTF